MDAKREVERLLHENGAVLVRSKRNDIWRLKSGVKIITPHTRSDVDPHAWANTLSQLRRTLGVRHGKHKEETVMTPAPAQNHESSTVEAPVAPNPIAQKTVEAIIPPAPPKPKLVTDIERLIGEQKKLEEFHFNEVTKIGAAIKVLESLLHHAEEGGEHVRMVLESLTLTQSPPAPKAPTAPVTVEKLPQAPTKIVVQNKLTVHVTRTTFWEACLAFGRATFGSRDMIEQLIGNKNVDDVEYQRVRHAVVHMLKSFTDQGKLVATIPPQGRRPGTYRVADESVGTRA